MLLGGSSNLMGKRVYEKDSLFDELGNLFLKTKKLKDPEEYDKYVYQINRFLSMDEDLTVPLAYLVKYLWVLRGRYYLLLWSLLPKTNKKPWLKYTKRGILAEKDRTEVRELQAVLNYTGKQAFMAKEILEKEGVDIAKLFGEQNA